MHHKIIRRPPAKQDEILAALRQHIVSGEWGPGTRLPTRIELEKQFQVSTVTVQRALDRLIAQGFVHVLAGNGTFVVHTPPHIHRFALVLPFLHRAESHFWEVLIHEARRLAEPGKRSLGIYAASGCEEADIWDYNQLQDDVRGLGIAGVIFAMAPHDLTGTPVLTQPGLPRVELAPARGFSSGLPTVSYNRQAFFRRGLERLRQGGCRRLAVLDTVEGVRFTPRQEMIELAAEFGVTMRPYWYQTTSLMGLECARSIMHLLFGDKAPERPDGLVIADDNLVEQATRGLCDAEVSAADKLTVVAHCNFPWPPTAHWPVTWLGYDSRAALSSCLAILETQRSGTTVPAICELTPVFADELGLPTGMSNSQAPAPEFGVP